MYELKACVWQAGENAGNLTFVVQFLRYIHNYVMKHLISEMKVILRWITCPAKIHFILYFVAIFYAWMKKFGHKDSKNTLTLLLQVVLLMARSYVTANIKWE